LGFGIKMGDVTHEKKKIEVVLKGWVWKNRFQGVARNRKGRSGRGVRICADDQQKKKYLLTSKRKAGEKKSSKLGES